MHAYILFISDNIIMNDKIEMINMFPFDYEIYEKYIDNCDKQGHTIITICINKNYVYDQENSLEKYANATINDYDNDCVAYTSTKCKQNQLHEWREIIDNYNEYISSLSNIINEKKSNVNIRCDIIFSNNFDDNELFAIYNAFMINDNFSVYWTIHTLKKNVNERKSTNRPVEL